MKITIFTAVIAVLGVFSISTVTAQEIKEKLAVAVNHFALDLYKYLDRRYNALVSPLGVETLMGLVSIGAGGKTADQMERVLGYHMANLSRDDVGEAFRLLLGDLHSETNTYQSQVLNRALLKRSFPVLESYKTALLRYFSSDIVGIGSENGVELANMINEWVNQKTKGRIPYLLDKPLWEDIKMALINTVYFKADWKNPFRQEDTKLEPFYSFPPWFPHLVDMMHQVVDANYSESEYLDCKALELSYSTNKPDTSMVFILPNERYGFLELEDKLDYDTMKDLLDQLRLVEKVDIKIPKFEIEQEHDLRGILTELGMTSLFGPNANLTGISPERIQISEAIDKAFVVIHENGTEATASSALLPKSSLRRGPQDSVSQYEFHADHPFIYVIRDRSSGSILFMGRVKDL